MTTNNLLYRGLFNSLIWGAALSSVLLLINTRALACTCSPEASAPACQLISRTETAFLGECVEYIADSQGKGGLYRFRVERIYKGLDQAIREVLVDPDNFTTCGTEYLIGKKYLMFAYPLKQQPLVVMAGGCSGSRRVEGNKSNVDFLESYVRGDSVTAIYGNVLQRVSRIGPSWINESAPLEGATIVLENSDHRFTFVSRSDGEFRFNGIPAGDYQLSARLDPYFPDPDSHQVSVSGGACKQVMIQLKGQSGIEGTLYGPDGKPASRQSIMLLRKNHSGEWYHSYNMSTQTNDKGAFRFSDIESGEYLLGHEIGKYGPSDSTPYPAHYFPGVSDPAKAEVITLLPQQTLRNLALSLPPPHTERKITIKVVGLDGKPPGPNLLQVSSGIGFFEGLEGDTHDGVVVFTGYQEREYEFYARYWIDNLPGGGRVADKRILKSDPLKVTPGNKDIEIVLVLRQVLANKDDR